MDIERISNEDIGKRITAAREKAGLTKKELAQKVQVAESTIGRYEKGYISKIKIPVLKSIADALNVNPLYLIGRVDLINGENLKATSNRAHSTKNGAKIPVLGEVAAGIPIEEIEDIIDYEEIPESLAATGKFFGLKIKGNSMEPLIHDGSIVIVKSQPDCNSGDIAIVSIENEFGTCKKLIKSETGVQLVSLNPAFNPVFYTNKQVKNLPITIIGKVVEARLKL